MLGRVTAPLTYLALALLVAGPLLAPGLVLVVDLALTPQPHVPLAYWGLPESTHGGPLARLPLDAAFAALGTVDAVALGEKALLLAAVFLAGAGMHRLARVHAQAGAGAFFAGLLYAVNPFVYDRLDGGQWFLLLGYALIPHAYAAFLRALDGAPRAPWAFGALFLGTGIASTHMAALLLVLCGITLVAWAPRRAGRRARLAAGAGALGLGLAASLYWLIPTPALEELWSHIGDEQLALYRTVPDPHLGLVPTVAALSGYWNNEAPLRDYLATWPVLALTFVVLAGLGLAVRRGDPTAWAVAVAGALGFLLALGSASALTRGPFVFLLDHVAFLRSFREPQKGVALVAFAYAFLGAAAVEELIRGRGRSRAVIAAVFLALPLINGYRVLWGLWDDLHTSRFPASWSQARAELDQRAHGSRTLFLPWHGYFSLGFAHDRLVLNPAPAFFDTPILASRSVGAGAGTAEVSDPTETYVDRVLAPGARTRPLAACLAPLGVQYILLAKEADWRRYAYLDDRRDVRAIRRWPDLVLYRLAAPAGLVMAGPARRAACTDRLTPLRVRRESPVRYRLAAAPPPAGRLVLGLDQPRRWRLSGRDVVFAPWADYRRNYLIGLAGLLVFALSFALRSRRR